jgi:hypothetical protein
MGTCLEKWGGRGWALAHVTCDEGGRMQWSIVTCRLSCYGLERTDSIRSGIAVNQAGPEGPFPLGGGGTQLSKCNTYPLSPIM